MIHEGRYDDFFRRFAFVFCRSNRDGQLASCYFVGFKQTEINSRRPTLVEKEINSNRQTAALTKSFFLQVENSQADEQIPH